MVRTVAGIPLVALICIGLAGCATIRKFSPIESRTLEARQLTQQAQSAMHREDWDVAEAKLVHAINQCPEDSRPRICLAEVLWNRGAKQAAVEELSRAIELSGQRAPEALAQLGQMQLELGNPQAAQQCADEAITQNPALAIAWTLRGFALRDQGRSQEALSAFFRAISLRGDNAGSRLEIATILREQGKPDRALAVMDAVERGSSIEDVPRRAELCYLRGKTLSDLNRPQDAVASLLQARKLGLNSPELLILLAESLLAVGDHDSAYATLTDAEKLSGPQYALALAELRDRIHVPEGNDEDPTWR